MFSPALPEPDLLLCLALRYLSLTSSNSSDQQQQQQQVKAESSQLTASAVYEVARPILQGCHAVQTRLVLHFSQKKSVLRIPGSRIRLFSIPDPGSELFHPESRIRIKEFKYFNPEKLFLSSRKYDPGSRSRIGTGSGSLLFTLFGSWILDPGGPKGTGSRFPDSHPQHWKEYQNKNHKRNRLPFLLPCLGEAISLL